MKNIDPYRLKLAIKLPNFIIAGVVKGGTTSIYSYLSRHPDICCSTVKETCYFSAYRYGQLDSRYSEAVDPFEQYQGYFSHCQGQKYIMEATPGYFEGGKRVAEEMKQQLGDDLKIIIIFREPIARLLSFFKYKKSMVALDKTLSLAEYVQQCEAMPNNERVKQENDTYWGLDGGFYANYVGDWFDVFGSSLKIAFFDDLKSDPKSLLKDLCNWLAIDNNVFSSANLEVENKSVNYKNQGLQQLALSLNNKAEKFWRANPKIKSSLRNFYYAINGKPHEEEISNHTLDYLKSLYSPYNKKLAELLLSQGYTKLPLWLKDEDKN